MAVGDPPTRDRIAASEIKGEEIKGETVVVHGSRRRRMILSYYLQKNLLPPILFCYRFRPRIYTVRRSKLAVRTITFAERRSVVVVADYDGRVERAGEAPPSAATTRRHLLQVAAALMSQRGEGRRGGGVSA
jgi:hypothetical protein